MNKTLLVTALSLVFLFIASYSWAQNVIVRGKVLTSDGKPAENISVILIGSKQTATNKNGEYQINSLKPGNYTLRVSSIGLTTQEKDIELSGNEVLVADFILEKSATDLQEVSINTSHGLISPGQSDYVAKMPLKNVENAQVYSTITKEQLSQQLIFNLEDALRNVPGITKTWDATNRASFGGAWLAIRGFATQTKARNGVSGGVTTAIDVANLERIEVIKGPSATLFGNAISSYGGLVNRVTKKPMDYFKAEAEYAGGSFGLNRLSADVNTPLDKDKTVLLRTNIAYNSQNSFQDFGFNRNISFAPSFTYKIDDRLTINLDAEISSNENSGGSQTIYFITPSYAKSLLTGALTRSGYSAAAAVAALSSAPATMRAAFGTERMDELPLDIKRSYLSNDLINKTNVANFFGELKYKISDQWTSQTLVSKGYTSSDGPFPYFFLIPNFMSAAVSSAAGGGPLTYGTPGNDNLLRGVWRTVGNENSFDVQQNFTGDFKAGKMRNRFAGGLTVYHYDADITYNRFRGSFFGIPMTDAFDVVSTSGKGTNYGHLNKGKVDSAFAASPSENRTYIQDYTVYSAFVNDVLNITDRLLVSAGLRLDHFDNKAGTYAVAYNQTALAPQFGIIYQPIKDRLSVFANYQSGFKNVTGTNAAGETFHPEQAIQWEGGTKMNLLGDVLTGSISYYDIKVKDIVRPDLNSPGFSIQSGEQISRGYELEFTAIPLKGLNLIAGYSHNNSKLTKSTADVEGLRPATAGPADLFNFWAAYQFSSPGLRGFGVGFGGNYAGEAYPVNSNSAGKFILPSYTLLNALLSYDHPKFRIGAKLNNLLDKHYWIGYSTINPQMTRQFIGSIAFKIQ